MQHVMAGRIARHWARHRIQGTAMTEEPPNEGTDDRPKLFKNMTAWIGGATGVVIALGGLATAYKSFMHDSPPRAEAQTNTAQAVLDQPDAGEQNQVAPAGRDSEPWYYTTDAGGRLRYVDGLWVETGSDGAVTARYDDDSGDGTTTVARLPGGGENGGDLYLRWPAAGGRAEKSVDRQQNWTDAYTVTVDDPARPPVADGG
jgi:hypothetical protein